MLLAGGLDCMIIRSLSGSMCFKNGEGSEAMMAVAYIKSQARITSAQFPGSVWPDPLRTR